MASCALATLVVLVPSASAGAAQRAPLPAVAVQRVLEIARGELARGVREAPAGSDQGPRIRTYVRSTADSFYPNPWCAYFASWVTRRAGVPIGPGGSGLGSVSAVAAWGMRTGRWHRVPRPSDLVVLPGHLGIVERVFANHTMTTIDGNWSNRVIRVRRPWSAALGYVRVKPTFVPDPPLRPRFAFRDGRYGDAVLVGTRVRFYGDSSRGDIASYSWDLDGDGRFGDARGRRAARAYPEAGRVRVGLRLTSRRGKVRVTHMPLIVEDAPVPAPAP